MCDVGPFNNDIFAEKEIKRILQKFGVKTFVETGTFLAYTTFFIADYVDHVISIEADPNYYNRAVSLNKKENVKFLLGNSAAVLKSLLEEPMEDPILFYLDAHSCGFGPLLDELRVISEYRPNNCIVVIDDFQVPNRPDIMFDFINGSPNNFDYVKEDLAKVFPDGYVCYYTDKYEHPERNAGKIFVFPKSWDCSEFYTSLNYSNVSK